MWPEDIRNLLMHRPFRAFRFYVLETTAYEIRHPELAILSQSTVTIYVPVPNAILPLARSKVIVALAHITRLEPILPKSKPSSNGD